MAIERNSAVLLLKMRLDGLEFGRVLMLGNQNLVLEPAQYRQIMSRLGKTFSGEMPKYAHELFLALGAQKVEAMDYSDYQDADVIQDLNTPIPESLHQQYDFIFDGGTLEHVFNFPIAIKNCMQMLKPGGRYLGATIPNNWCGHGFYQFSPELFYRLFSVENGFKMVEMYIAELAGQFYQVKDPAEARANVELCNSKPVFLLVHARREAICEVLARPPVQSSYIATWAGKKNVANQRRSIGSLLRKLPVFSPLFEMRDRRHVKHRTSLLNRRVYTKINIGF